MKALISPSDDERDERRYVGLVSWRIRYYRQLADLPLERLARDADVSRETLRLIEDGLRMPTLKTLHRLAGALGLTVHRLTNETMTEKEKVASEADGGFTAPNGYLEEALTGS